MAQVSRISSKLTARLATGVFTIALTILGSAHAATVQLVPIPGNHPLRATQMIAPQAMPSGQLLEMQAYLKINNPQGLAQLLRQLQDPASPLYHRWLPTGAFAQRFNPSLDQYQPVSKWLRSQGLVASAPDLSRRAIPFTGTVAQVDKAFGVKIVTDDGGIHYGNATDPLVPANLAGSIAFIAGLDDLNAILPASRTFRSSPPETQNSAAVAPSEVSAPLQLTALLNLDPTPDAVTGAPEILLNGQVGFAPNDMYTFYDADRLFERGVQGNTGSCIALIEAGDYMDQWVPNFNETFSLPATNLSRILVNSVSPGENDRTFETMFDIDWAHSMAPLAAIKAYVANGDVNTTNATFAALISAVGDNSCNVISISIESCGLPSSFYTQVLDPIYEQASTQGQTTFVAIGDEGAAEFDVNDCGLNGTTRTVSEMAADPNIVSVGGTQFNPIYDKDFNDVGFVPEAAWNEPLYGTGSTGGGGSAVFPKLYYQNGLTPADGARDVPDIAFESAYFHPGVFSTDVDKKSRHYGFPDCCYCGTSLGAPSWAGITELIIELLGHRLGNINPALYQLGALADTAVTGIRDTTRGNNDFNGVVGFVAQPGYDQTTGWGTPDITQLATNFANAPLPGRIAAPVSVSFGASKIGSLKTSSATISNVSNSHLHGVLSGLIPPFTVLASLKTFDLGPHQSMGVALGFAPTLAGEFTQQLDVASDDPSNPSIKVTINGEGTP